jgi:O-acetyl-ADP-ribose deacetylase (regulator of RNase III)/ADP-ribose pyrophosphatase YjhB (NUDIX family)
MKLGDTEILIIEGDIASQDVQAIVNAANNHFFMGGGVAGVIKRRGGSIIEQEAIKQGPVELGEAILTSAGSLKARYVIHAVTMKMDFKTDEEIIRKATFNSLLCAQKNNISSIAFCALGCGVGGFSYEAASKIMAQEVFRYLREIKKPTLKKIFFVLNSREAYGIFAKNVVDYLNYLDKKIKEGPFITVDGIIRYQQGIVLIERSNPPLGWALPGGFVDYGESVEEAVLREIKEETSLDFVKVRQFKVYSRKERDPRFHTISVVFTGEGKGEAKADSDAKGLKVFSLKDLPPNIVFDHKEVINDYIQSICQNNP